MRHNLRSVCDVLKETVFVAPNTRFRVGKSLHNCDLMDLPDVFF